MANPWYAFYPGDYGRDTAHLSLVEDGAYRRLLDRYYTTGRALPDDIDRLFRICRAFTPAEQNAVRSVLDQFFVVEDGSYWQKRVERELVKQTAYQQKLSESGRRGAEKRWGGHGQANRVANGVAIAEPQPQPQPQKDKPAPRMKRSEVDSRFKPFVEAISTYWKDRNAVPLIWDKSEGKHLKQLLAASPELTVEQFTQCLANRAASEGVAHSERPRTWLGNVLRYANGPLNQFGKPAKQSISTYREVETRSESAARLAREARVI